MTIGSSAKKKKNNREMLVDTFGLAPVEVKQELTSTQRKINKANGDTINELKEKFKIKAADWLDILVKKQNKKKLTPEEQVISDFFDRRFKEKMAKK